MKTVTKIRIEDYRGRPMMSPASLEAYLIDPDGLEAWVTYEENGETKEDLLSDMVGEIVLVGDKQVRVM